MKRKKSYKLFKISLVKGVFLSYIALGTILLTIYRSILVAFLFPFHAGMYMIAEIISDLLLKFVYLNGFTVNLLGNFLTILSSFFVANLINRAGEKWNIHSLKRYLTFVIVIYLIFLLFLMLMMFTLVGFFI